MILPFLLTVLLSPLQDEEKAFDLVGKAWDRLQESPVISIHARMVTDGGDLGEDSTIDYDMLLKRPDHFRMVSSTGNRRALSIGDGVHVSSWYSYRDKPVKIDQTKRDILGLLPKGSLIKLFYKGRPTNLSAIQLLIPLKPDTVRVSRTKFEGQECDHIWMESSIGSIQIWIDAGNRIVKIREALEVQAKSKVISSQITTYTSIRYSPKWKEEDFVFTPPEK